MSRQNMVRNIFAEQCAANLVPEPETVEEEAHEGHIVGKIAVNVGFNDSNCEVNHDIKARAAVTNSTHLLEFLLLATAM
jgi:hypothetical protein